MGLQRRISFFLIIIFLLLICFFASSYNTSVRTTVENLADKDEYLLQEYNTEISEKLSSEESIDSWEKIINEYENVAITVEDNNNNIIAKNGIDVQSFSDVTVRTAFEYHGNAYLITSSIYIFRNFDRGVLRYVVIELSIAFSTVFLVIMLIYTIMLRPFRKFYMLIEEYEKSGDFGKYKFHGFVGKVYERFIQLTQNLESQQNKQRRIIASISHDIKTPLTSIMGYAERLKKDNIPPERRQRYLETVYNKSLEIRSLVDEFDEYLGYNMLQDSKTIVISTKELCKNIHDEYTEELESIGIRLKVISEEKKSLIKIDPQKIKRVFDNLIGNSLKHFDKEEKKILIEFESNRDKVLIRYGDNGEGVDPDMFELIFEPLYTSDKGRKVAGLGLTICREIVESHGGKIYAQKSPLGGLEICIELEKERVIF